MSTTIQSPKPKRCWYQFSLRTLLVVMTVSIVAFGVWIQFMRLQARENRARVAAVEEAVAAIEKLGGRVTSEKKELRPQSWLESQFDDPGDADDPAGVLTVSEVNLFFASVTDADLEHLKALTNLQTLNLSVTNITDAGLEHLEGLTNLGFLYLSNTNVTDAGLEHLTGLKRLEILSLHITNVTDEGVKKLQQSLPNCEIVR